ncbi:MAG TPA: hypothetical protein P5016_19420 [Verrucomicrobiales bacterium]|nr:hypothetical protein [Verrucomicrobiae bacterium]MCP5556075.1 hypothetical protein [Akkermansiaceae bacterium]HRX56692.1 hypothetical protein [Verrucomicrobiales bacterium]
MASPAPAPTPAPSLQQQLHWLMPLHFFYERQGQSLPEFTFLGGKEMPYPYRSMLVHENDMTPTLAAFHHSRLCLEVLQREQSGDYLLRCVILRRETDGLPVEFGAIGIHLGGFSPGVRRLIEDGQIPLGGILGEHKVEHHGSPSAFFSVIADDLTSSALIQPPGTLLYGRCNQLLDADGLAIADIVEILPRSGESEGWIENAPVKS